MTGLAKTEAAALEAGAGHTRGVCGGPGSDEGVAMVNEAEGDAAGGCLCGAGVGSGSVDAGSCSAGISTSPSVTACEASDGAGASVVAAVAVGPRASRTSSTASRRQRYASKAVSVAVEAAEGGGSADAEAGLGCNGSMRRWRQTRGCGCAFSSGLFPLASATSSAWGLLAMKTWMTSSTKLTCTEKRSAGRRTSRVER
jgi:hypothetical protein